jgi:hypothetical protein
MKKILILSVLFLSGLFASAQIQFGFAVQGYDNFSNTDTAAAFELVVFTPNNDTLDTQVGATLSSIDGSASNGVHYNFAPQAYKFPIGTTIYNGSNRKKFKINPVADSKFWGKKDFIITLTNLIGVDTTALMYKQNTLRIIIDYDGTGIGLPKLSVHDYKLYPVPASTHLTVDGVRCNTYKIADLSGRIVAEGIALNNSIDVSGLSNGIYVLTAISDKGMILEKFIKE